jgi:hypothetical protein
MLGRKLPKHLKKSPLIYFITEIPTANVYKIGLSTTGNRLEQLQTGSSAELIYDFVIPVDKSIKLSKVEHLLHNFYSDRRRRKHNETAKTEWFNLTSVEASIVNVAFVEYKALYLTDRIMSLECFEELLITYIDCLTKPALLNNLKMPTAQINEVRPLKINKGTSADNNKIFYSNCFTFDQIGATRNKPVVIDLTVDEDQTDLYIYSSLNNINADFNTELNILIERTKNMSIASGPPKRKYNLAINSRLN